MKLFFLILVSVGSLNVFASGTNVPQMEATQAICKKYFDRSPAERPWRKFVKVDRKEITENIGGDEEVVGYVEDTTVVQTKDCESSNPSILASQTHIEIIKSKVSSRKDKDLHISNRFEISPHRKVFSIDFKSKAPGNAFREFKSGDILDIAAKPNGYGTLNTGFLVNYSEAELTEENLHFDPEGRMTRVVWSRCIFFCKEDR